jgi:hypothetical protein
LITRAHIAGFRGLDAPGVGSYEPEKSKGGACIRTDLMRKFGSGLRPALETQLGVEKSSPGKSDGDDEGGFFVFS